MLEGYRQIVSDPAFFALQRTLMTSTSDRTITGDQFIEVAKRSPP